MAIPRKLPAALGAAAALMTTAVLIIHAILAHSSKDRASSVRITAIVAAALEATIFTAICCLSLSHIAPGTSISRLKRANSLWFGAGSLLCAGAAAVSVSNLICLSRVVDGRLSTILDSRAVDFMAVSSVILGLAFATQLAFFVFHFVAGRIRAPQIRGSHGPYQDRNRSPPRVKSIAYHETRPIRDKVLGSVPFESRAPPGSSGGRSAMETMSSIRSSFSQVLRPISSKTRLLSGSQRSSRGPASLDLSGSNQSAQRSTDDGFDSWDTSAVDPQNRQTVLESSSPPLGCFLETIPATPATSRSPSPGTPLDILEPPRTRRRSRSYSPVSMGTIQAQRTAFTQHVSQSESHIHPLFRSDSPTPPPIATPGTVVTAAPNGGQIIISDKQSIRSIKSLRRMRSESLPPVPSPLSRQGSCDLSLRRAEGSSPEIREEDERPSPEAETERKMTPPIPDWILSAGSRTSLTTYNSRKLQVSGNSVDGSAAKQQP
ncbi:hypothetical protein VTK56DRAFT_1844 [Thermocarpiscus australiensis]